MSTRSIAPIVSTPVPLLTPTHGVVLQRTCDCGQHTVGGAECEECKKKKGTSLQRRSDGAVGPAFAPAIVHEVLNSPGEALAPEARAFFEPRFGQDFSHVRVHQDARAAESARSVHALAYAVGNNLVFGAGQYAPRTSSGKMLLAHELTHVAQQRDQQTPALQRQLEVGPADDHFEREANRMADEVVFGAGSRATLEPVSSEAPAKLQRAMDSPAAATEAKSTPTPTGMALVVEDDDQSLQPGQMRKGEFLNKLQISICAAADEELKAVGRTTQTCPYLARWMNHLRMKESAFVERALRKYAPEAGGATKAEAYIAPVTARVRRGVARWAESGEITEVPDELRGQLFAANIVGAIEGAISGIGGTIGRAASAVAGGVKKAASAIGGLFAKERDGGLRNAERPQEIRSQLGSGHPLDGSVQSRMASAFGGNFAHVRVHTDSNAAQLSSRLNARAFALGNDIAFGAGEYQPGTLIGDALIAHELAHVLQQGNGASVMSPQAKNGAPYDALEEDADLSAIGAVALLWGRANVGLQTMRKNVAPSLKSGLRLSRCGGSQSSRQPEREPDKLVLKDMTSKQRLQFAKEFIERNFVARDRGSAGKILEDMLQSNELSFRDEEALRTEIFKRMETVKFMQESQGPPYGVAFDYPNKPSAKACLPGNQDGKKINPRVNKAAEPYWGPVQDAQGDYHFDLSDAGKQNAYQALSTLFTHQKSICDMTLIHCDYLASVVHFRAFAESIGIEEFNRRVRSGAIKMRLAWNGFRDLEEGGGAHSKESTSLREVRPRNEGDLVIGDHVIFWNHRAYDAINKKIHNAWRLENAILINRRGKVDHFLGHGSGEHTDDTMRDKLASEYNIVVEKAKRVIDRTKSKDPSTASAAQAELSENFPYVINELGEWKIVVQELGRTFPLTKIDRKDPNLTGLRDRDNPTRMNCVKRPVEAPGESC